MNHKLDQSILHALNAESDNEQLKLRMVHQEKELRKLKERVDAITQTA